MAISLTATESKRGDRPGPGSAQGRGPESRGAVAINIPTRPVLIERWQKRTTRGRKRKEDSPKPLLSLLRRHPVAKNQQSKTMPDNNSNPWIGQTLRPPGSEEERPVEAA